MPVLSFLVFVFVSSFTPGPNNMMAIAFAKQHGFRKTLPFSLGVGCGFFLIIFLCSIFNILPTSLLPVIQLPLAILGVGYMVYLAYKIATSKSTASQQEKQPQKHQFFIGLIMQFINPKGILFGISVVATFILPYYHSYLHYLGFSLFLGIVGVMSTFSWSLGGSLFQNMLARFEKPFNIVMALLLLYSAVSILLSSIS